MSLLTLTYATHSNGKCPRCNTYIDSDDIVFASTSRTFDMQGSTFWKHYDCVEIHLAQMFLEEEEEDGDKFLTLREEDRGHAKGVLIDITQGLGEGARARRMKEGRKHRLQEEEADSDDDDGSEGQKMKKIRKKVVEVEEENENHDEKEGEDGGSEDKGDGSIQTPWYEVAKLKQKQHNDSGRGGKGSDINTTKQPRLMTPYGAFVQSMKWHAKQPSQGGENTRSRSGEQSKSKDGLPPPPPSLLHCVIDNGELKLKWSNLTVEEKTPFIDYSLYLKHRSVMKQPGNGNENTSGDGDAGSKAGPGNESESQGPVVEDDVEVENSTSSGSWADLKLSSTSSKQKKRSGQRKTQSIKPKTSTKRSNENKSDQYSPKGKGKKLNKKGKQGKVGSVGDDGLDDLECEPIWDDALPTATIPATKSTPAKVQHTMDAFVAEGIREEEEYLVTQDVMVTTEQEETVLRREEEKRKKKSMKSFRNGAMVPMSRLH